MALISFRFAYCCPFSTTLSLMYSNYKSCKMSLKRIREVVGQSLLSFQRLEHKGETRCFIITFMFLIGFVCVNYHMANSGSDVSV